ncbi:MAG: histidine phosphatase family protein [Mesorhizobium sp.]|nr:histidine phosphatase family protein [Mesorhizobium sp.]MBL8577411.1 histidine phosphatase family protein [Mesorhizobium sp.]
MPPLCYFVRHGQTGWNAELRLQGQADTDITELGRRQAARNGQRLAELVDDASAFDFVASPLKRTRETMEIVRTEMGLQQRGYRVDSRLMEVHFGDWQGYTYAELETMRPGSTAARLSDKWGFVAPGGESYQMLLDRVRPWFEALDRQTICVTHGGVIRTLFKLVDDKPVADVAAMEVPQDRVLRLKDSRLEWL